MFPPQLSVIAGLAVEEAVLVKTQQAETRQSGQGGRKQAALCSSSLLTEDGQLCPDPVGETAHPNIPGRGLCTQPQQRAGLGALRGLWYLSIWPWGDIRR